MNIFHGIAALAFAHLLELFAGNLQTVLPFSICVLNRITAKFSLPWVFLCGFFSGMIFTVVYCFIVYFITGRSMQIGASYIYLSMFFSFATLYPDMQVLLYGIIPLKVKWLAWFDAVLFAFDIGFSLTARNWLGALLPIIAGHAMPAVKNMAIGGTSVIIVVGVALETVKALEAQMMMRHYKGFLD